MNSRGFGLTETLVAITILAAVLAGLAFALVGGLRTLKGTDTRTQAALLLEIAARLVGDGDPRVLPTQGTVRYGAAQLGEVFPELKRPPAVALEVADLGLAPWSKPWGLEMHTYRLRACWEKQRCLEAFTFAPPPNSKGAP